MSALNGCLGGGGVGSVDAARSPVLNSGNSFGSHCRFQELGKCNSLNVQASMMCRERSLGLVMNVTGSPPFPEFIQADLHLSDSTF